MKQLAVATVVELLVPTMVGVGLVLYAGYRCARAVARSTSQSFVDLTRTNAQNLRGRTTGAA